MAFFQCDFFSSVLDQSTRMNVILPEGWYSNIGGARGNLIEKDFPVLYLLHGYGGDETQWWRWSGIELYCRSLPLAVVMPRGNHHSYIDDSQGYDYGKFLTEELPAKVKHFFPVSDKREDTFIAGLSMGGFGAMRAGLANPGQYAYVASMSGVLNPARAAQELLDPSTSDNGYDRKYFEPMGGPEAVAGSGNDILKLATDLKNNGEDLPNLFVSCGTEDSGLGESRDFKAHIESLGGFDLAYEEWSGGHDWQFWDESIQKILQWLPLERYNK